MAKYDAELNAWSDPDKQGALLEEYKATFAAADTNGDGRLDANEFKDMMEKDIANRRARGVPTQDMSGMTEEQYQGFYQAVNSMSEQDGITADELMSWGFCMEKKLKELRA